MFRYVLFTMMCGLLLGGGVIGCGEDSPPAGGGNEGEGEGTPDGGEGEGSAEGEGEGPLPPGGDGEPCGDGNTCQDGLSCLTCEEGNVTSVPDERFPGDTKQCEGRICTCPQWFGGTWWAEFEPRAADGREFDFTRGDFNRPFWMDQEVTFEQKGCLLKGPDDKQFLWTGDGTGNNKVSPAPNGFFYERFLDVGDNAEHPLRSYGTLSQDRNTITGICEGEYLVQLGAPELFNITCSFVVTRR